MSAFALPPPMAASSFTGATVSSVSTNPLRASRCAPASRRAAVTMIQNPFGGKNKNANQEADSTFMAPQPGDPGYVAPPPVPKGTGMAKSEPRVSPKEKETAEAAAAAKVEAKEKKAAAAATDGNTSFKKTTDAAKTVTPKAKAGSAIKLPVSGGDLKRGLDLLKEDVFKNAPSAAGVGRQDVGAVMKPLAGEPGYKPAAYETVKVSDLGISPFPDDPNAVGKVGGVEAVKKAAVDVKAGTKTGEEIRKEVLKEGSLKVEPKTELKIETKAEAKVEKVEKVFDIPDYLKPIPEDTPRKGYTWKNYVGR